jgi:hypothetical protein
MNERPLATTPNLDFKQSVNPTLVRIQQDADLGIRPGTVE